MSALARYFHARSKVVYGYDKTPSALTLQLEEEGIVVNFEDSVDAIPEIVKANREECMVVYTPAIPRDSAVLSYVRDRGFDMFKRSQVLGMVTDDTLNLSIAGTHGKTTTSCMLAAIFKASDVKFTAFLGGISADLESNFYHQQGEGPHYSITEADEYDRSFLQLSPSWAAITSTDSDHLDIYGTGTEVEASFKEFANKLVDPDCLFIAKHKVKGIEAASYSASTEADYWAVIHERKSRGSRFSIMKDSSIFIEDIFLSIPGTHNIENAIAASILANAAGLGTDVIKKGLSSFKGIKRRFEFIVEDSNFVFVDDYAHHPSELKAIIGSVKEIYPHKRLCGIFQPHLYSRTKDFADGFAEALSVLDEVILLPVYPARELPMQGVESEMIAALMTHPSVKVIQKDQLIQHLTFNKLEVLLTLGAGDIDRLVQPIKDAYLKS